MKPLGDPFLELVATKIIERVEKSIESLGELAKGSGGNVERDRGREMDKVYEAIAEGVSDGFRVGIAVSQLEKEIQHGESNE